VHRSAGQAGVYGLRLINELVAQDAAKGMAAALDLETGITGKRFHDSRE
jgi:hypothetical protein